MKKTIYLSVATLTLITLLFLVPSARAYTDTLNRFSITPPTGWTVEQDMEGVIVAFLGPQDPDVGPVNINIDIQETSQTLDTIIENTKQSWSTSYSDYSLITDESLVINGHACHELEVSYTDGETPIMQDSVLFLENDALLQVTYLAGPTTYDTYSDDWVESLSTLQLESTPSPSPDGFSFHFELTGLPFLLLLTAVAAIVVVIVAVLVRKSKANSSRAIPPPPPPQ